MPREYPANRLRPVSIETGFLETQPSSVVYSSGHTKVLCIATLEAVVPNFLLDSDSGWATAEYDLLPGATRPRHGRERSGRLSGRTQEIQRLIGRALRGVLDLKVLTGFTLRVDCDVLQADGGTRTASINGAYVAAVLAVRDATSKGKIAATPFRSGLGAVSVGIVGGKPFLDLDYKEDSSADVDLNVVQNHDGDFLEVQGTAEGSAFSRHQLDDLLTLASAGIQEIFAEQEAALGEG